MKMETIMQKNIDKFKAGELKDKYGNVVTDPKKAIDIALSEIDRIEGNRQKSENKTTEGGENA